MSDPVSDLVDYLDGDSALGLVKGTDLFQGPMRGVSDDVGRDAVFISAIGGPAPQRFMGQEREFRRVLLTVRVRWGKFAGGHAKSQAIQNTLQGASISGYLDVKSSESFPTYIGQDESGNHIFLSNYELAYEEVK